MDDAAEPKGGGCVHLTGDCPGVGLATIDRPAQPGRVRPFGLAFEPLARNGLSPGWAHSIVASGSDVCWCLKREG